MQQSKYNGECLPLDFTDSEGIAEQLYDPKKRGVLVLEDMLTEEFLTEIVESLATLTYTDYRREGAVDEYMHVVKFGNETFAEQAGIPPHSFDELARYPALVHLFNTYEHFYHRVGRHARFSEHVPTSLSIHRYPPGIGYLGAHQDFSDTRNLIGIFNIDGEAEFYSGTDRKGKDLINSEQHVISPGSLTLLRAPRAYTPEEKDLRPWHEVRRIITERHAIIIRAIEPNTPSRQSSYS